MTTCQLLAGDGPQGMVRAHCPACGYAALLELPAAIGDFCAWIDAQERAHASYRYARKHAAAGKGRPTRHRHFDGVPEDETPTTTEDDHGD